MCWRFAFSILSGKQAKTGKGSHIEPRVERRLQFLGGHALDLVNALNAVGDEAARRGGEGARRGRARLRFGVAIEVERQLQTHRHLRNASLFHQFKEWEWDDHSGKLECGNRGD